MAARRTAVAPFIADFYKMPELKWIVRVSAVSFIYNAINSIQGAELTKKMLFHLSFRISLISTFTSAIVGVTLAFLGFGVWAFVLTSLVTGFVGVISRWYIIAWRPQLMFSFARLKPLFPYGWKMAASGLLDSLCGQLNGLLIGKFYTRADLAYVDKGRSLPSTVMGEVNATVGRVSFPALVQLQDDKVKLRDAMRRMMVCSTFLVMLAMVGLCCVEAAVVFGVDWVFNSLGFGFASTGSLWSLAAVLIFQLVTGALTYLSLAYVFRLKPMGEYARMFNAALGSRFPRLCACLMRRFGG